MANDRKIKLPPHKLQIGMMVDLELPWTKHPFFFSKFRISTQADIAVIRQMGLKQITVFPEQSKVKPTEDNGADLEIESPSALKSAAQEKWREKEKRIDDAEIYRTKRNQVAKKYREQSARVRALTRDLKTAPANAIRDVVDLVDLMAQDYDQQTEILTNLVNLGSGKHTQYNHTVNVTILSMNIAAVRGIQGDELKLLARGALLHDVGKVELPDSVVNKTTPLNRAETGVFRQHPQVGRKLCELVEGMPQDVLKIIELHHEYMDGSGYPKQLKGDQIPEMVKIVTVANIYDNLCNPPDTSKAMTPKVALATMFSKYKTQLDNELVQTFISTLGVFPPGSVIKLNDQSIGLVICVDPHNMLNPEVLLYNPEFPPDKALIINLAEHADLKIEQVLKPGEYPPKVYQYLGIEERIGFMTSQKH